MSMMSSDIMNDSVVNLILYTSWSTDGTCMCKHMLHAEGHNVVFVIIASSLQPFAASICSKFEEMHFCKAVHDAEKSCRAPSVATISGFCSWHTPSCGCAVLTAANEVPGSCRSRVQTSRTRSTFLDRTEHLQAFAWHQLSSRVSIPGAENLNNC